MNWNDYEAAWKRQPLPRGADADLADLKQTFETKHRKMAASLLVRDGVELLACAVVLVAYVGYWRKVGAIGWPMGVAILLILVVAGMFIRERLRARRLRLGTDASLLAKVEADIAELRHQCRLIGNVWKWYLTPCAGAMAIHFWVIVRRAPAWSPVREPWTIAAAVFFMALAIWFAWLINRRALRRRMEPRLAELEKLRQELLDKNGGEANAPVLVRR